MEPSSSPYPRPDFPQPRRRPWLLEVLLIILILFIGFVLFMPLGGNSIHAAKKTVCLSNLKQQALAEIMYSADANDRFTPGDAWMDRLLPYHKNEQIYHCPEVAKGSYGYALNPALAGAPVPFKTVAAKTPLVYESFLTGRSDVAPIATMPNPSRHGKGNNLAYADGHQKVVPVPQASP